MASTYLERTVTTPDTNGNKIATFSAWLKRASLTEQVFYTSRSSDSNYFRFRFTSGQINVISKTSGTNYFATTSAVFRDISSWYHVIVTFDTTQATEANRIRIYVNGVEQTKGASSYPSQDSTLYMLASGQPQRIGKESSDGFYDGLMTQVIYTEGYAYAPSDFGSTNTVSGEWIPNANPTVSYGSNGFKLTFEDTAALGDDTSGNTNDFTMSGSGTPTLDCPSNNFPTFNNLIRQASKNNLNIMQGNLYSAGNGANNWRSAFMTIAAKTGKYYCEMKCIGTDGSSQNYGVSDVNQFNTGPNDSFDFASQSRGYGLNPNGNKVNNGGAVSVGTTYTTNDIVGMALDLDNGKIYFSKNGTYYLSGDPTSGSTGTGSFFDITTGYIYSPTVAIYGAADNMAFNFGNGYFRTTAVTSAGTPGSTVGVFEYDVPTGYQPWSTKGINV